MVLTRRWTEFKKIPVCIYFKATKLFSTCFLLAAVAANGTLFFNASLSLSSSTFLRPTVNCPRFFSFSFKYDTFNFSMHQEECPHVLGYRSYYLHSQLIYITAVRDFLHNFILIEILFSLNIDGIEERTLFSITIVTIIILLLTFLPYLELSLSCDSNTQNISFGGCCCGCYIRLTFIPTFITPQHIIFKIIVRGDCVVFISIIVCGQGLLTDSLHESASSCN